MKRLPKIEDTKLMTRIARLQSNTDFIDFRDWLFTECEKAVIGEIKKETADTAELRKCQGVLQVLDDLLELFENSEAWSLNMQSLANKKKQAGR